MTNNDDKFNDPILVEFIRILESNGFQIVNKLYSTKSFGNIVIDMCRDQIRFRLVKDRGYWDIRILNMNKSDDESYMYSIRSQIDNIPVGIIENWGIEEQIDYIEKHVDEIISLLSNKQIDDMESSSNKGSSGWLHRLFTELFHKK